MIYKQVFGEPRKGWVLLLHGLGEHSGRHSKIIQLLNNAGLAVYAFDWEGHGKSKGKKGHTKIEDVFDVVNAMINEINEKPFLLGYSLGGLAVIRYSQRHPDKIRGTIASAPSLIPPRNLSPFLVKLVKFLGTILPSISMNNTIVPKILSRNNAAVERYINDSLVHDRISFRLAKSLFENIDRAHRQAGKIKSPILILHGTADVLSPIDGSLKLIQEIRIDDKQLVEFEGAFHELFEDKQHSEQFYETILDWINTHADA